MEIRELETYFKKEADAFPGKVAYYFQDFSNPALSIEQAKEEQVVSASMIKVPVMVALFEKMREGVIELGDRLNVRQEQILEDSKVFEDGERTASFLELITWMIINSDNTASNVLMSDLGFDALNDYFQKIGLTKTKAERLMLDHEAVEAGRNNYISPMDFYHCMCLLREQEKTDRYAKIGMEILSKNRDFDSLCRYLYEGPYCAHKTGGLDDIVHDAGIIRVRDREYFLGVFVSEFAPAPENERLAERLIGRLSRKVFDFYKAM
ncbi:MAG: serine hydrolase [Lachnospiraceae bacterium]